MTKTEVANWLRERVEKFITQLPDKDFLTSSKTTRHVNREVKKIPGDIGTVSFLANLDFVEDGKEN